MKSSPSFPGKGDRTSGTEIETDYMVAVFTNHHCLPSAWRVWTRWAEERGSCSPTSSPCPGETTGATPPPPPTVSATPGGRGAAVHTKEMLELLVRTEDSRSVSPPVLTIFISFRRREEAARRGAEQAERGTAEKDRGDKDEAAECKFCSLTLQHPAVPPWSSCPPTYDHCCPQSYLSTLTSILL